MQFSSNTHRLVLAILLAAGGLLLAGWTLWPRLVHKHVEPVQRPATAVQLALGPELLDTDTETGSAEALAESAGDRLREVLRASPQSVVSSKRAEDLVAAFLERLVATTAGDYWRDTAAKVARGMPPPPPPPSSTEPPARWVTSADWTRGVRIGLERLEVRTIFEGGKRVTPHPVDEGYHSITLLKKGATAFPVPEDPAASRSDVVEVRLPMGLRPVRGESRGAVLVGYRFLWSQSRRQWIPFSNVIYKAPGETYAGLPF